MRCEVMDSRDRDGIVLIQCLKVEFMRASISYKDFRPPRVIQYIPQHYFPYIGSIATRIPRYL